MPVHLEPTFSDPHPPKLLDRLRMAATTRGFVASIAEDFVRWTRRFILFHGTRHPNELGAAEVGQFLAHIARAEPDPLPAINQARQALDFLFRDLLCRELGEVAMPKPPRLLDQMRQVLRVRNYSPRTEGCYVQWAERFIRFHGMRHPVELGAPAVEAFLTPLAVNGKVAASTQNQAKSALLFLYREVLQVELPWLDGIESAKAPRRLPVFGTLHRGSSGALWALQNGPRACRPGPL